ncbi:MAG: ATP-binding protein [Deltaproteobacteria bacterium]
MELIGSETLDGRYLVDHLPAIVLVVSAKGRIVHANREATCRLATSEEPSLEGKMLESLLGEPNVFDVLTFDSVFLQGPTHETLIVFTGASGDNLICSANSIIVTYENAPHVVLVAHSSGDLHDALASTSRWAASEQNEAVKLRKAQQALAFKNKELQDAQRRISETSRVAGMAEIATGILHNVGNVLNSVNVSADVVADRIRHSRVKGLFKAVDLMKSQEDLAVFLTGDPRGRKLLPYLIELCRQLEAERVEVDAELAVLQERVERIKSIVAKQQRFARVVSVVESCRPSDLVSEGLDLVSDSMLHHHVEIVRDEEEIPELMVDRHRFVQILVNLLTNATNALSDAEGSPERQITIRLREKGETRFVLDVIDNGVGIAPELVGEVFKHGFTTRKNGHGFGLHDSANAATELGGSLTCASDGLGRGATFRLELPMVLPTPCLHDSVS